MSTKRNIHPSVLYPFGIPKRFAHSPHTSPHTHAQKCAIPGCPHPGEYRAPTDRTLTSYMWLCLDHVREYNRQWNYLQGMTEDEMERQIRLDTCWQRPSWRLGTVDGTIPQWARGPMHDPFGFTAGDEAQGTGKGGRAEQRRGGETPEEKALRVLNLVMPLSRESLRARFAELAKLYHPDVNPGDKTAEDRLKEIIDAYRTLLAVLNA